MGFCSLYLSDEVDTRFNQLGRNDDRGGSTREGLDIFSRVGRPLGKAVPKVLDEQILEKAHRYVLFNCDAVLPYISQHVDFIEEQHSRSRKHEKKRLHSETFATWFSDYVESLTESRDEQIMEDIKFLARGPTGVGIGYKRYITNGSRFQTKEWESKRKTQNSGVVVSATTSSFSSTKDDNPISSDLTYYGVLKDIFELDYTGGRKVVLFECDWVSKSKRLKKDDDGFTLANFKNIKRHNEPFVLASQVKQVFYVEDPTEKGWHVVVNPNSYED
ncbi:hypothetical protein ACJIZ3_008871 [Penstemon smallii]|uniref:DUF4216 domain-containing protein n=1 Tax=Penstemon smallii TaxID=265156 RepID=A0ABD3TBT7_9LAMI